MVLGFGTSDVEILMASSELGPHSGGDWPRPVQAPFAVSLSCSGFSLGMGVPQLLSAHHTVLSLVRWASLPLCPSWGGDQLRILNHVSS